MPLPPEPIPAPAQEQRPAPAAHLHPRFWRAVGVLVLLAILTAFVILLHQFGFERYLDLFSPELDSEAREAAAHDHFASSFGIALFYSLQFLLVMPVLHYAADFSNQPWYQTLAVKRVPLSVCANWLGIWFVSMTCVVLLLGQVDQSPNEFMALMLAKPHWLMLVATIVLAPLMEEALFRGYLFRAIDNTWLGATGAILLTSIVFTLVHAAQYNLYGMLQIFSLALLLGVARQRTGSLLVPMLIHATQNTLANLVPLLTG